MATTTFRFLPWARRGLAGRIATVDTGAPLAPRSVVSVGLKVTAIDEKKYDLSLYGPGDVIGVDTRLIIRTDPRPNSTDVEPNYFPAIEFDPPDFPWMFTPAGAGANDRLRPWCVLIVVDLALVAEPRAEAGHPLPVLIIPPSATRELPDLTESWAWAHSQLVAPAGAVDAAAALAASPATNVSRIVAPRRLEPGKQYAACLVPAFDAGVKRGLGDVPSTTDLLKPAWAFDSTSEVRLPVYFHWVFATGPAGDFESLARRLKPFKSPADIGTTRMYVGDAGSGLPQIAPDAPGAVVAMDGALRAVTSDGGHLSEISTAMQAALRSTLNAPAAQMESNTPTDAPVLGAPIYGAWHARQQTIPDAQPVWLRELNLDPRARAAAGLGAEIERRNQQQFMQWCWEQVGDVLKANQLLNRARLSVETLSRVHARHFAALPVDRLFQLTAPLHTRAKQGSTTIAATLAQSSLPNSAADPALRRLTSSQRPVLRAAALRTTGTAAVPASTRVRMISQLAVGKLDVDPTRFIPHGLLGVTGLSTLTVPATGDAAIDLTAVGLPIAVPASLVRQLRDDTVAIASLPTPKLVVRPDLRTSGILVDAHIVAAREQLDTDTTPGRHLFDSLGDAIKRKLPTVPPTTRTPPRTRRALPTRVVTAVAIPDLVKDVPTITRLERAVSVLAPAGTIGTLPFERTLVPFNIAPARDVIVARMNPRVTIAARLGTMLSVGGKTLLVQTPQGIVVAPTMDRVMATPSLDVPVYSYLAELDPERFLPGVGEIPEDTITVLETNPRFVESVMAGLNVEMGRELLWQSFPTDQRGTPFRRFWAWLDGRDDIPAMHQWARDKALGKNSITGNNGLITLLVRGRLLRRYPNTSIYAWRAKNQKLINPPAASDLKQPVFSGVLGSDIAFVGFELSDADLTTGDGWFFVLQEQPTEPRFGFDEPVRGAALPALTAWSDATWDHTATLPGSYLRLIGNPLVGTVRNGARFVDHAAHLASITLQKPMRIAVNAKAMIETTNG